MLLFRCCQVIVLLTMYDQTETHAGILSKDAVASIGEHLCIELWPSPCDACRSLIWFVRSGSRSTAAYTNAGANHQIIHIVDIYAKRLTVLT